MNRRNIPILILTFILVIHIGLFDVYAANVSVQELQLKGSAWYNTSEDIYVLTEEEYWKSGEIWFNQVKCNDDFSIEMDFYTGHLGHYDSYGGADGICVMFYADSSKAGANGGFLGFEGYGGYGVEIDTYCNTDFNDPFFNHIAIIEESVSNHLCYSDASSFTEDGAWHHLRITNRAGSCTVYVDGVQQLQKSGIVPNGHYEIGISAATGAGCNYHAVKNIQLNEAVWTETSVTAQKYCIHVVNENGEPLQGATVYWEDAAETLSDDTDKDGKVFFPNLTLGTPKIDVSLAGYTSWTNRNSNWSKSDKRYSVVKLYQEAYGEYKLSTAYYSNSSSMSHSTDLLTQTKKLNLKNDGNLIGDLDFGNFYLSCSVADASKVEQYELYQNSKKIASCTSGSFDKLSVKSFSKGGGCFVRVTAKSGEKVDTAINLEFTENKANKESSVSIKNDSVSLKVKDDVPFLGGSTFNLKIPIEVPVTIVEGEDTTTIALNLNIYNSDEKTVEEQVKDYYKKLDKAYQYAIKNISNLNGYQIGGLKRSLKRYNEAEWFKKGKVYFSGCFEYKNGSKTATGYIAIIWEQDVYDFEQNHVFPVGPIVVPVTLQFGVDFKLEASARVDYKIDTETLDGNVSLNPKVLLDAFIGVGCSKYVGTGVYGKADLDTKWNILGTQNPNYSRG